MAGWSERSPACGPARPTINPSQAQNLVSSVKAEKQLNKEREVWVAVRGIPSM